MAACRKALGDLKVPREIRFDEMPRSKLEKAAKAKSGALLVEPAPAGNDRKRGGQFPSAAGSG